MAIADARAEGFSAEMLLGISTEDCLIADLGIDPGDTGMQSMEATQFKSGDSGASLGPFAQASKASSSFSVRAGLGSGFAATLRINGAIRRAFLSCDPDFCVIVTWRLSSIAN